MPPTGLPSCASSRSGTRAPRARAWLARAEAEHARFRWQVGDDPPELDELVARWEHAVTGFEAFGHVFERARSQARLAAVLTAAGRTAEAAELTADAAAVARSLGAEPLLRELRTLGAPAGRPDRPPDATSR